MVVVVNHIKLEVIKTFFKIYKVEKELIILNKKRAHGWNENEREIT